MKIGVFDSGVGGLSVAKTIMAAVPGAEVIYRDDKEHVPYGTRPPDEVYGFVEPIFQSMVDDGCQLIVVACNTVSTTLIDRLRRRFTVPLIAIEPMVKPAARQTRSGVIAICATPATLGSERYRWLKAEYAAVVTVLEPDCTDWARMIEHDQVDDEKIRGRVEDVLNRGADVIVLGCTHYHWIQQEIEQLAAGRAQVIQPEDAIVRRVERVMRELELANGE